jgi:hypothetical protein
VCGPWGSRNWGFGSDATGPSFETARDADKEREGKPLSGYENLVFHCPSPRTSTRQCRSSTSAGRAAYARCAAGRAVTGGAALPDARRSGVRGLLIYCADYKCSHWIRISADQWPDDVASVRSRRQVHLDCLRQARCRRQAGFRLALEEGRSLTLSRRQTKMLPCAAGEQEGCHASTPPLASERRAIYRDGSRPCLIWVNRLGQHDDQHRRDRGGEGESADNLPCCLCQKQMLRNIVRRTKMLPHLLGRGAKESLRRSATVWGNSMVASRQSTATAVVRA